MQSFIHNTRNSSDKQWIFDLIAKSNGLASNSKEPIIMNCDAWFMCHNILTKEQNKEKQEMLDQDQNSCAQITPITQSNSKRDRYDKEPRYLVIFKTQNYAPCVICAFNTLESYVICKKKFLNFCTISMQKHGIYTAFFFIIYQAYINFMHM